MLFVEFVKFVVKNNGLPFRFNFVDKKEMTCCSVDGGILQDRGLTPILFNVA